MTNDYKLKKESFIKKDSFFKNFFPMEYSYTTFYLYINHIFSLEVSIT